MQKTNLIHNKHNKNEIDFRQLLSIISASKLFIISITIAFTVAAAILGNYFYTPLYKTSANIKIGVYSKPTLECNSTPELEIYCIKNEERYEFLDESAKRIKRLNMNFNNNKRDIIDFDWDGTNIRIKHTSTNSETGKSVLSEIITYMQDKDLLRIQNIIQNRKEYLNELINARDNQLKKIDRELNTLELELNDLNEEINLLLDKIATINIQIESINNRIQLRNILLNSLNQNDSNYFEQTQTLLSKNDISSNSIYGLTIEKFSAELFIKQINNEITFIKHKISVIIDKKMLNESGSVSHLNQVIDEYENLLQNSNFKKSEIIGKINATPPSTPGKRNIIIGFILGLFLSIYFTIMKQLSKERRQTA